MYANAGRGVKGGALVRVPWREWWRGDGVVTAAGVVVQLAMNASDGRASDGARAGESTASS